MILKPAASLPIQSAAMPAHPDGFVPIAFAEAKWQEREQQFAIEMAALQALVAGNHSDGNVSAAQSDASDAQDPTSLDFEVEDDGWKQVGKEARKTIAAKHRVVLASRMATSISKVTRSTNPFQKAAKKL